jgi:hypothetical protein
VGLEIPVKRTQKVFMPTLLLVVVVLLLLGALPL